MRERLRRAPWWVWALVTGIPFGTGMWAFGRGAAPGDDPVPAVVITVLVAAAFGSAMGLWVVRTQREMWAAVHGDVEGSLPPVPGKTFGRALAGNMPDDPAQRRAADRMLRYWSSTYERQRPWAPLLFAVMTVAYVYEALTDSRWWWLAVALAALMLVGWLRTFARLRRAVRRLGDEPDEA